MSWRETVTAMMAACKGALGAFAEKTLTGQDHLTASG
jgi:hypothetical protein